MAQLRAEKRAQRDQHLAETAAGGRDGSAVAAKGGGGGGAAVAAEAERVALRKEAQADAKQQALLESIAAKEARAEARRTELEWERQRRKAKANPNPNPNRHPHPNTILTAISQTENATK